MAIFTCTDFTGLWPVPVAAVIDAETKEDALEKLNKQLKDQGLKGDAELSDIEPLTLDVTILSDGNY